MKKLILESDRKVNQTDDKTEDSTDDDTISGDSNTENTENTKEREILLKGQHAKSFSRTSSTSSHTQSRKNMSSSVKDSSRISKRSFPKFSIIEKNTEISNTDINESDHQPSTVEYSNNEENIDGLNDEKFVVYEGMLDKLISFVHCKDCFFPVAETVKSKLGTSIHYKLYCGNKHLIVDWKSQPLIGKTSAFNLLMRGSSLESFKKPAEFSGLKSFDDNTFSRVQGRLLIPSINHSFKENIQTAREAIKSKIDPVVLGNESFDSSKKSAKSYTYTCKSPVTKEITVTSKEIGPQSSSVNSFLSEARKEKGEKLNQKVSELANRLMSQRNTAQRNCQKAEHGKIISTEELMYFVNYHLKQ